MKDKKLEFEILDELLGIARLEAGCSLPKWLRTEGFFSVTSTDGEVSIVCPQWDIPGDVECEKYWKAIRIKGTLDFSMVGVLAELGSILASEGISIFVISTYRTDYILVKASMAEKALVLLEDSDCKFG